MKLLIITQKVDKSDPVLGFFHRWLERLALEFEKLTVICLEEGEHALPDNVKVLSLGKEDGRSHAEYLSRFYSYIWDERRNYDKVFVHMNQEYVILGHDIWMILGKPIYLWRNHAQGNMLTRLAVIFSKKVFYTSPASFTAKFKKAVQMPVGIDTDFFKPDPGAVRIPNSVLFLGRISPVKKVEEFVEWLKTTDYTATIAGPIGDKTYADRILNNLPPQAKYVGPVNQEQALKFYQTHEIYVNKTSAGSFDKTIFEAMASGCKLMVDNPDAENISIEDHTLEKLVRRIKEELA